MQRNVLKRMALVAIVIAVLAHGVLFSQAGASTGIEPAAATATRYYLRVYVASPADVTRLTTGRWDVLEARGPDFIYVLGDDATIADLRAQGFRVEIARAVEAPARSPFSFYGGYRTVAEHYQHMDDVATLHPDLALTVTYGVSWQRQQSPLAGFDLRAICITKRRPGDCALNPDTDKPRFFLMAAIHARELTTSEMAWRWIDLLVDGYGADPDITALLDDNEMWVVPVTNPDGRHIVETTNIDQRKNANTNYCPGYTFGADLNRNASFKWNVSGTSPYPCDLIYAGASAASEPEEQGLEALMSNLFRDQRGPLDTDAAPITTTGDMLTLHTFSNLVLLPWGWTECSMTACPPGLRAPNDTALREMAFRMSYFNGYYTGQAGEALYAASGTSDDWAYGVLGIPGFTFEMGLSYGDCSWFDPPYACQDSLFWPQNRGAILYAAKVARQPYALALGPTTTAPASTVLAPLSATVTFSAAVASDLYGNSGIGRPAPRPVAAAEFYVDTPPWVAGSVPISMTAQDGAFDGTREGVTGSAGPDLSAGRHTLYIRGRDAAGNWGPTTARWINVLPYTLRLILVYKGA
jgi:carboxypeptidase T